MKFRVSAGTRQAGVAVPTRDIEFDGSESEIMSCVCDWLAEDDLDDGGWLKIEVVGKKLALLSLEDPCSYPGRNGMHEVYAEKGVYTCRACGLSRRR